MLVIVGDDVGWSERPFMPALDTLARQGVTFTRAYAFPLCSPTRCAAFTGTYPRRSGMGNVCDTHQPRNGSPPPDRREFTLAEALLPTHSTALIGKWHLGRAWDGDAGDELLPSLTAGPFTSGFERWLAGNPDTIAHGPDSTGYYDWFRVDDGVTTRSASEYATAAQRDAFLDWWSTTSGPRFAWLAFNAAHWPYDPPPGYPTRATEREQYLDVVDYLDGALEAVLASVDLSTTYVVYFGDNGAPSGVRASGVPAGYGKGTTYEGGIRVPLIVAGPGITPGLTSSRLVSLVDLPATLEELVGAARRRQEDSRSFANELGPWTGTPARSFVFSERYDLSPPALQPATEVAVIESAWKYRSEDPDGRGPLPTVQSIYYLPNDPYEQHPLDPALPQLAAIRTRLLAELASLPPRKR